MEEGYGIRWFQGNTMSIESSEDLVLIADVANLLIEGLEPGDEGLVKSIITQYKRLTVGGAIPRDISEKSEKLIQELNSMGSDAAGFQAKREKLLNLSNEIITMAKSATIAMEPDKTINKVTNVTTSAGTGTAQKPSLDKVETGELIDFFNEAFDCLEDAESGLVSHDGTNGTAKDLKKVFRAFHNIKAVAGFVGMKEISRLAHFTEALLVKVREQDRGLSIAETEACFESIAVLRSLITDVSGIKEIAPEGTQIRGYEEIIKILEDPDTHIEKELISDRGRKVGEMLVEKGIVSVEHVGKALEKQTRGNRLPLGELLVEKGVLKKKDLARALRLQAQAEPKAAVSDQSSSIFPANIKELRASTEKAFLAILENSAYEKLAPALRSSFESVLNVYNMTMTDLDRVMRNAAATAMDVAAKESILVNVQVDDASVKVDWDVAHELLSPLIHIVRNSIVHGIEAAFERNPDAEDMEGLIRIKSEDRGTYIRVSVEDNGVGLNFEKVARKAEEKGVKLKKNGKTEYSFMKHLFFMEKVSTSDMVTELSGRGVGLDVVKEFAVDFMGSVDIGNLEDGGAYVEIRMPSNRKAIYGHECESGAKKYMVPSAQLLGIVDVEKDATTILWNGCEIEVISTSVSRTNECKAAIVRRPDAGVIAVLFESIAYKPSVYYIKRDESSAEIAGSALITAISSMGATLDVVDVLSMENI